MPLLSVLRSFCAAIFFFPSDVTNQHSVKPDEVRSIFFSFLRFIALLVFINGNVRKSAVTFAFGFSEQLHTMHGSRQRGCASPSGKRAHTSTSSERSLTSRTCDEAISQYFGSKEAVDVVNF